MIAREIDYGRKRQPLPARVYLSVGSQEEHQLYETFAAAMKSRGYEQLDLVSHVFEGETHASVVAATMYVVCDSCTALRRGVEASSGKPLASYRAREAVGRAAQAVSRWRDHLKTDAKPLIGPAACTMKR